jgi:hypothetical protein
VIQTASQVRTKSLMEEFREYGAEVERLMLQQKYEPLGPEQTRRLDWLLDQLDEITTHLETLRCL